MVFEEIKKIGIVPVIAIDDPELAPDLANALCDGGLPIAEVTFRMENVEEVMSEMKKARPDMILGAGTVLSTEQVDRALSCGCQFIVSPGLNEEVTKHCIDRGVAHIPGVVTPSEVEKAMSYGHKVLKFFPAELSGGLAYIKALCAPYRDVYFVPTGGVNPSNLANYLAFDKVAAAGGTWIAKTDMIKAKKFDEILKLSKEAKNIVNEVR